MVIYNSHENINTVKNLCIILNKDYDRAYSFWHENAVICINLPWGTSLTLEKKQKFRIIRKF